MNKIFEYVLKHFFLRPFPTLLMALALVSTVAHAQLSSPMGESVAPDVRGVGAGFHSPNSPIAPLKERADVVSWTVLTAVKTTVVKNRILPVFPDNVRALHQKTQRIQGFMMPLGPGEKQKHFLLSSVPLTCPFCVPGGPESMVEVKTKKPIRYSLDAVVVEGVFSVLEDDPYGLYYRMTDAVHMN